MIDPIFTLGNSTIGTSNVGAAGLTGAPLAPPRSVGQPSFVTALAQAEAVAARGLLDAAGPREVAEAVMQAERSFNAAIAVRDKIVSSFLEISRMAI